MELRCVKSGTHLCQQYGGGESEGATWFPATTKECGGGGGRGGRGLERGEEITVSHWVQKEHVLHVVWCLYLFILKPRDKRKNVTRKLLLIFHSFSLMRMRAHTHTHTHTHTEIPVRM